VDVQSTAGAPWHLPDSALDRLCEFDGARWVYDTDELGAIRRDVMTILTHHAASRQATMAPLWQNAARPRPGVTRNKKR
jgi:hypothetical protein